uniref:BPTI/Kunitz inhibitor domain-containing protein n=1 Tax=Plectus sambesii TaxID=2011161 RepID=A0A914VFR5_9BILA
MQLLLVLSISFAAFFSADAQNASACTAARNDGTACAGRAGSPTQKFFYDTRYGVCQPFMYQGCNGNDNRFDTVEKCRTTCANAPSTGVAGAAGISVAATNKSPNATCPGGAAPFMVVKGVPAVCRASRDCSNGYGCSKGACCPNKVATCSMKYDAGNFGTGGKMTPMYYYNPDYKACMLFTYFGYGGNANNFLTYNDCIDFCT